jgi:hypothetical protein
VSTVRRQYRGAEAAPGSIVDVPSLEISGSATDRDPGDAVTASDVTTGSVQLRVRQLYQAVSIDNLSRTFQNIDFMNEAASRLGYNLAAGADSKVAALWNEIPFEVGTLNGDPFFNETDDIDGLAAARKIMSKNLAPFKMTDMHAVFGPEDVYGLRTLDSYKRADKSGTIQGRVEGALGTLEGFQLWESQQIQTATLGNTTEWSEPGAVAAAGAAKGATSLPVDGIGSGTIPAGSTFEVNGDTYAVTADATISGNAATLPISPPLKAAAVDNDVVTPVVHSAAGAMNLAYNSNGILFIARPTAAFAQGSGVTSVVVRDSQTGLGVRISHQATLLGGSNVGMTEALVADLVCGAKLLRPEYVVKCTGSSAN